MTVMLDTVSVLLAVALILVIISSIQPLAAYLKLPPVVLLAGVGIVLGAGSSLVSHIPVFSGLGEAARLFSQFPISSELIIYVFLPLLVFEAGITTDVRRMFEDAVPILILAVIATLLTTAVVGFALWPIAGVSLLTCLVLGTVISPTDPAAVIAIFRDVGAPARLARLVEAEALLNDATAIALFAVLLGMIASGGEPDVGLGAREFVFSFAGGAAVGIIVGRAALVAIPWLRDDRLAEATLTLAVPYLAFIAAQRLFDASGIVATLVTGLTYSYLGRSRISPHSWSFLDDLWEQTGFWARSLVFVLAAILIPALVETVTFYDVFLVFVLAIAAFGGRLLILYVLLPPLSWLRLTEPIGTRYKLTIAWGALRGALTLALALAVTENPIVPYETKHFVAVLATGLLLFTLFVNGTTLRPMIRLLGLDRLSPRDRVLRDQVLAVSYEEVCEAVREMGRQHRLAESAIAAAVAPYEAWIAANVRDAMEVALTARARLGIALVALGNQERALVLEIVAHRTASPVTVQTLLGTADAVTDGARSGGRLGYQRCAARALAFGVRLRFAYFLYRRLGISRLLAARLGERFEILLSTRLLLSELAEFNRNRLRPLFDVRICDLVGKVLERRIRSVASAAEALRRQYPEHAAQLEARFLRQSALRRELARYETMYEDGLIGREVYDDLRRSVDEAQMAEPRPRFELGS
jgi:CPA1 family monovalent cation:H+ antiporter